MKRIIILTISVLILTACGQQEVQKVISQQTEKGENEITKTQTTQPQNEETEIVKYDGTTRVVNIEERSKFDYYTELSPQIMKFRNEEGACKRIESTNYLGEKGTPPEIYEDKFKEEFKGVIAKETMDAFIAEAKNTLAENNAYILSDLCEGSDGVYLAFWDQKNLYISIWDDNKFITRKTIGVGKSDYNFYFVPNYFGKNHLIGSGTGDAGLITWGFDELNFETGERNKIEGCRAETEFKETIGFTNKIDVHCDVEYSSEKGVIYYDEYQLQQCKEMEGAEKDSCILSLAAYDLNKYRDSKIEPNEICPLILNNDEKNQCFWGYAMKLKSKELCGLMPEEGGGEKYSNKSRCLEELKYENGEARWTLDSGIPLSNEGMDSAHYKGSAVLSGWVMTKEVSPYSSELFFHVIDKDLIKLPILAQGYRDYRFTVWTGERESMNIYGREDLPDWLDLTEENPGKIKLTDIIISDEYQQLWLRDY